MAIAPWIVSKRVAGLAGQSTVVTRSAGSPKRPAGVCSRTVRPLPPVTTATRPSSREPIRHDIRHVRS